MSSRPMPRDVMANMGSMNSKCCGSRNNKLAITLSLVSTFLTNLMVSFVCLGNVCIVNIQTKIGLEIGVTSPLIQQNLSFQRTFSRLKCHVWCSPHRHGSDVSV